MRFFGENLSCVRGERLVFSGLEFAVDPGTALVLTGSNGSGKTSLLRVMAGLTRPTAGHLAWQDGPVADDPERHHSRLHYVGHLDALKPVLSVRENLQTWAQLHGGTDKKIASALKKLGLEGFRKYPRALFIGRPKTPPFARSARRKRRATLAPRRADHRARCRIGRCRPHSHRRASYRGRDGRHRHQCRSRDRRDHHPQPARLCPRR